MTSAPALPLSSRAEVATASASKYLQQLCKHFGHKVEATFDAHNGRVTFPMGTCELAASDAALVMRLAAADAQALERLKQVMASHLVRFAFREELTVTWSDG
ncbi:DUF2218 domain-containing protein [Camelimonas abortus]|uniref:DUF2218 domain-containing protein n=1 Tax=Camelimonas abortus TaxID=1017184 RepID=A0ABV7LCR8_9HYPH